MSDLKIGDIVARKSYGEDIHFTIADIKNEDTANPIYVLRGLLYRIVADGPGDDLVKQDSRSVYLKTQKYVIEAKRHAQQNRAFRPMSFLRWFRSRPGSILHIDSSQELLNMCLKHYREARLRVAWYLAGESEQPNVVGRLLNRYRPDILVVTGHDGLKKNAGDYYSMSSYRNSSYFVQSVKEARKYQPSADKLCVFAGACQSYFEAIMDAGANFASSPGRVLINGLDPAIVSEKVATTPVRNMVSPQEVAELTISGSKGIGGVNTRGHLL
ncbi:MAG: sporulation peptidase YabG [Clostridiales bacterium]|jgi:spore coat assembly protein|nr:sporulation peptidase YabG [Eubacteriales bacterium]MDH7565755.1 sporulation peptidase YabG [Clostridiales bacterium]